MQSMLPWLHHGHQRPHRGKCDFHGQDKSECCGPHIHVPSMVFHLLDTSGWLTSPHLPSILIC